MKMNANLSINEVYIPYLCSYRNYKEIYYGGAGSGKSYFVTQKLLIKALKSKYKRKILVIRKVGATLKDSVWQLFIDLLIDLNICHLCKINKSNFSITLPNGCVFLFKGLDNPEKIKSIAGITDIWIEEATELNMEDYNQLELRLRPNGIPNPQIILSFNPISKANWCYKTFFKNGTDAFVLHTTYKDNKFLPKKYIDNLLKMKNDNYTYYKIYALGEFATLDKLVFTNWQEKDFDVDELIKTGKYKTVIGLDFGWNDPTALIVGLANPKEKELYLIDEYKDSYKTYPEIAQIIKAKGYSKDRIIAESARPEGIEEIKRNGIYRIEAVEKTKILDGVQALQQYTIFILPKLQEIKTEFQNYTWKKDKQTNEYIDEPIDDWNHLIDALRYGMTQVNQNTKKFGAI